MRLFTAFDVPAPLQDRLSTLQEEIDLDAKWTSREQFHVTVRFIGEVSREQAVRYEQALAGIHASTVRCVPYGLDVLPSRRSPRVLMLGFNRTDSLMTLYEVVSDALDGEGLDPESRTYRPHVTLGRLDEVSPERIQDILRSYEDVSPDPFTVDHFILYESTLRSDGAVHDPQATFPLSS